MKKKNLYLSDQMDKNLTNITRGLPTVLLSYLKKKIHFNTQKRVIKIELYTWLLNFQVRKTFLNFSISKITRFHRIEFFKKKIFNYE